MVSLLESIIFSSPAGVLIVNESGDIMFANKYANECLNDSNEELHRLNISRLIGKGFNQTHQIHMANFFKEQKPRKMEGGRIIPALSLSGKKKDLEIGLSPIQYAGKPAVLVTFINVTDINLVEKLKQSHMQLERLANYDDLTQLPNRQLFNKLSGKLLQAAIRENQFVAVAFVDINNFKQINDNLGHLMGDEVIKLVAGVIKQYHRKSDVCCRYGGDEFIIYFHNIQSVNAGKVLLHQIHDTIHQLRMPANTAEVSASIGMAVTRAKKDTSLNYLIDCADQAMYQAKKSQGMETKVLCYCD